MRSAEAALKVAEAQLLSATAQVGQNEAGLRQAQLDLEHTIIRAPVDGVVVSRTVDVGQTVAASLQAPTLFTIAQDLTKMQVDTNVDEADVGRVKVGQQATFTVDAFPGAGLHGRGRPDPQGAAGRSERRDVRRGGRPPRTPIRSSCPA